MKFLKNPDFTTGIKSMELVLGSITLEVLQHMNSFLKQYTGPTGILLNAGSKMRAVNLLHSKEYSMTSKNPLKGSLSYGTRRFPLVKSFKLA